MSSSKNHKVAMQIMDRLKEWKPYIWHAATTGSIYIKFPHWGLGSIRIGDHPGRGKYTYRFIVRTDFHNPVAHKTGSSWIYTMECIEDLYEDFIRQGLERGIKPGDEETWEEHVGIPVPEWKKTKYRRGALRS